MHTKVQEWGNDLVLRIPAAIAIEAQLEKDSVVEVSLVDGHIVIKPVSSPTWALEQLLSGVKSDNIHHETEAGDATGNELW